MSMFGYNTLGFGSIAGTAGPLALNYAQTYAGTINNGTSITIGTARATRWVVIQGVNGNFGTGNTFPTSCSIGGITAGIISARTATSTNYGAAAWIAWAKVPTGTTATVNVNQTGGPNCRVSTFDSVNSNYSGVYSATVNYSSGSASRSQSYTVTNPGIVFSSLGASSPSGTTNAISTNSPGGITYTYSPTTNRGASGYNITSTTDSRSWTYTTSASFKTQPAMVVLSVFFSAN